MHSLFGNRTEYLQPFDFQEILRSTEKNIFLSEYIPYSVPFDLLIVLLPFFLGLPFVFGIESVFNVI